MMMIKCIKYFEKYKTSSLLIADDDEGTKSRKRYGNYENFKLAEEGERRAETFNENVFCDFKH